MAAAMYDDRCTIRRLTSTTGTHGGQIPGSPTVLATDVPCRTRPASATERQVAGATQGETALVIKMPAWHNDAPLTVEARCEIEIAARDAIAAQVLKIIAPLPNQGISIEVVATKVS